MLKNCRYQNWSFDKGTGTLTISGKGEMNENENVPEVSLGGWREYIYDIKKIVIGEGITRIGAYSFGSNSGGNMYTNLSEIKLPNSLKSIGSYAFANSGRNGDGIREISFPKNLKEIDVGAFESSNLYAVDFPESLRSISTLAFAGTNIKKVYIPVSYKHLDVYKRQVITYL